MAHHGEAGILFWRRPPSLYLQQSSNGDGWGVFAARNFNKGEIVEMAPMFLRFVPSPSSQNEELGTGDKEDDDDDLDCPVLQTTVLNHYHYEYWAWVDGMTHERQYQLSFGYMLYFNHSSFRANIQYCHFGKEPDLDDPSNSVGLGYYALRDVRKGEELLTDYGGPEWFSGRGIDLVEEPSTTTISTTSASHDEQHDASSLKNDNKIYDEKTLSTTIEQRSSSASRILVSKLYCECDMTTRRRIFNCHQDVRDDPPYDLYSYCCFDDDDNGDDDDDNHQNHDDDDEGEQNDSYHTGDNPEQMTTKMSIGYGNIICRQDICDAGETLEAVPALVLPKRRVIGTLLESIMIEWDWMDTAIIPTTVQVMICSSTEASDGANNSKSESAVTRSDIVEMNVHDTVLLPLAGCISMIARDMDTTKYNAVLELEDDPYNSNGYIIRVVSTRSIAAGESVIVNLPEDHENASSIVEEIVLTGQKLISST